ncbi:uncharacterized protein EHS24_002276 [Apiotrichum porosum]|uniref:Uncharacterized protein n=1 Tax=Apiotrichum porosum TaxID=105984 RepID=A0A427XI47_9TREE|nr:uncharacterized protein EHS24_002276 [Apiotrichum porosum]RSH78550.1 hypothetical protein EHS24_002276 [Apiotrichum porosum]
MSYNYGNSDDDDCEGDCFGTNEGARVNVYSQPLITLHMLQWTGNSPLPSLCKGDSGHRNTGLSCQGFNSLFYDAVYCKYCGRVMGKKSG